MIRLYRSSCRKAFYVGLFYVALAAIVVSLAGCAGWNVQDEGFRDNDMAQTVRKARSPKEEKKRDYWSFSEKGQQIERDLAPQ